LIEPLLALGFSGRNVINLVSSGGADDKPEDDPTEDSNNISSSSSGCDTGLFSLIFLVPVVPVIIRKKL
ncbi:MAG: hypothetical protein IJU15_03320, partial [Synergistaceae bacterium]|nr:hypothetical protein [Synergistaceae bacterium]